MKWINVMYGIIIITTFLVLFNSLYWQTEGTYCMHGKWAPVNHCEALCVGHNATAICQTKDCFTYICDCHEDSTLILAKEVCS